MCKELNTNLKLGLGDLRALLGLRIELGAESTAFGNGGHSLKEFVVDSRLNIYPGAGITYWLCLLSALFTIQRGAHALTRMCKNTSNRPFDSLLYVRVIQNYNRALASQFQSYSL
jgi:hypothetical protein